MRHLVYAFAALVVLFAVAPVHAANMPNDTCSQLGVSQMSDDQMHIIVCLKPETGTGLIWKSTTGESALKPIICTKNVSYGFSGRNGYTFNFTAAECGGTLPDFRYTGSIKVANACNGLLSVWVYNAGETVITGGPAAVGPAAGGYFNSPCTWSGTSNQAYFQALYVPK